MSIARLATGAATAATLALAACSPYQGGPGGSGYLAGYQGPPRQQDNAVLPDDISYWDGDGVAGPPSIRINRRLQKASFYKGDQLVGVSRISTGKEGFDTPPGRYKITQKNKDHRSNLYGIFRDQATGQVVDDDADLETEPIPPGCVFEGAPMPYFMRFHGGIGMHTGFLPGYNASHGCVRMPDRMARKFFANVDLGTPVIVE